MSRVKETYSDEIDMKLKDALIGYYTKHLPETSKQNLDKLATVAWRIALTSFTSKPEDSVERLDYLYELIKDEKWKPRITVLKEEIKSLYKLIDEVKNDPRNKSLVYLTRTVCSMSKGIEYEPVRDLFTLEWDLSEDFSDIVADEHGDTLNPTSRKKIYSNLTKFLKAYRSGSKIAIYDSVVNIFYDLVNKQGVEEINDEKFSTEFYKSVIDLKKGSMFEFYRWLGKYSQRTLNMPTAVMMINLLNALFHGKKYVTKPGGKMLSFYNRAIPFLESMAIGFRNNDKKMIYESYEKIHTLFPK